eukprot:CAMPEP_0185574386 /NCGR_PEP_ID=MMETSP0434-20130131/5865_1 /TAXON_ID=626734 ORGANISM="Favella taraikaensis, Strain Fe Narragansett Bay" /NCGR_SAMPLE_ID=MMETSP0434 /ASSEMBLY_ACC=CAM_ASM_000379 /LENGTH=30 /DNA_ID= /DNA_START= /DNA_END= /DNA_ORIENTATION=
MANQDQIENAEQDLNDAIGVGAHLVNEEPE